MKGSVFNDEGFRETTIAVTGSGYTDGDLTTVGVRGSIFREAKGSRCKRGGFWVEKRRVRVETVKSCGCGDEGS